MATCYVRPDTSHSGTRDGLSYATAWGGWSEINWVTVGAGGTLYVCGQHTYNTTIVVGNSSATKGNETTIRGDYVGSPGSITFTSGYLNYSRSHFKLKNLRVENGLVYVYSAGSYPSLGDNITLEDLTLVGSSIKLEGGVTGGYYRDILVKGCNISGINNTSAVYFLGGTANAYVSCGIDGITVENCTIHDVDSTTSGSSGVEFRLQPGNYCNASTSYIRNVKVLGNTLYNIGVGAQGGCPIRLVADVYNGSTISYGCQVLDNVIYDSGSIVGGVGLGGNCISGFMSRDKTLGSENIIARNKVTNMRSAAYGGFNIFYSQYLLVEHNVIDGIATTTIDGNGFLLDHGNDHCAIRNNTVSNCLGKAGVLNSGCAIMLLDSSWCSVSDNVFSNTKHGIYVDSSPVIAASIFQHNVFNNVTNYGVYATGSNTKAEVLILENTFVGNNASGVCFYQSNASPDPTFEANTFSGFLTTTNSYLPDQSLPSRYLTKPQSSFGFRQSSTVPRLARHF